MAATRRRTRKRKSHDSGVSFAAGFHLPTLKQSRNAIGLSIIPNIFEPGPENAYFQRIPNPNSVDDWLAQYDEEGQTFKNFLRTCPWKESKIHQKNFYSWGEEYKREIPRWKNLHFAYRRFRSKWLPSRYWRFNRLHRAILFLACRCFANSEA